MPENRVAFPAPADTRIAIIGLGYVGLPLAAAFAEHFDTLGFDISARRIAQLRDGHDETGELDETELPALARMALSDDPAALADRNVFVVAVPTPVTRHNYPDMGPLVASSQMVGRAVKPGAVVIFESTVYPGATEEVCVPELERASGLVFNRDFHVGYSPERINPGDRRHRLRDIVKVTSGSTPECAQFVDELYRSIVVAGTHLAPDIRTAEASKAIENTQRDVNIALVNEFAQMFHALGMDTQAVLAAAASKWNFLPFQPGLVGGHCIGVDPYYLIHRAQEAGYFPELVTAARRINDGMAGYLVDRLMRAMALAEQPISRARVLVMGVTFKEDCPDLRNSQVGVVVEELRRFHMQVDLYDPVADPEGCRHEFGEVPLTELPQGSYHAVLLAVAHRQFRELGAERLRALLVPGGVLFDVKRVLPAEASDARL